MRPYLLILLVMFRLPCDGRALCLAARRLCRHSDVRRRACGRMQNPNLSDTRRGVRLLEIEPLFLCEKARIERNCTLPLSLFFSANLFKDEFTIPWRAKLPGFSEGPKAKLQPIVNLNWNADPLSFYAEKLAFTWPTCTQAFTAGSTFFLMWARMNRCSCIYYMQHTF